MKHPYKTDCLCARCSKERLRRLKQANHTPLPPARARRTNSRRTSQDRAEQDGGLIGGYETDDTYCPD